MRQRLKIASVLLALFAMALGQGAAPRRIHVNASATCGFACDGSAASPFASLVSALRSITSDDTRVELLVSPGDYTGSGNTGLTINFAQNVSIRSTHGAKATTIDCEGKANRAFFVRQTSFSLHGFTIQNCNPKANGGAIFAVDSQVTLDAVRFINNTAFNGGAVYAVALPPASPTSMTITSSLFQNNKALNKGGAFYISRVLVTASNSAVKCNHASNKVASSGDDMYCEASSTATFDLSSDVQRMGVSCPINGGIACSVTYQNWTGSSVVTQQLCDAKPTCGPLSSLLNDVAPDAPDFMGWCGNGICDEQFESCLSCPQDCSTCSFTGVKLEAFKCLPPDARNVTKRGICAFKSISQPSLVVEDFLPNVPRPVTGIMSAYFRVPETDRYTFKLIAQNLGAKLKINTRTLIDALFPNSQIDSVGSVFLSKDIIHAIEVEFFSARDFGNNVQVLFKSSNSSFTTLDNAFYSLNDCGDGILDPKENTSQPFYCADDVNKCQTYSCQPVLAQPNTCGNGICDEDFKEDCFVDCYSQLTNLCPQLQEPAGKQTNGIPLANDTLGILLKNQYYYRLPGVEHLMNGFDILNGEESALPVFYFGFCDKKVVKTIQDSWRGYVYTIPAEIFAQPFPQCSFSMQSEKHASSKKMAESKSKKTGVSKSVSGGGGYGGVTVSAGAAFSKEKSVKQASELETSTEGFLLSTEVSCLSSKAQMIDYTFHPIFLSDLATVENSTSMLSLLYKYGTHFYDYVSFGGKLTQVRVISKSFGNSMSSHDMSRSSQRSFSSSVSSPAASVTTTYTKTNEVHTTAEEQEEFENNSASSKIITYGGAPGSFGPQDDEGNSEAPTNFGEWARTVDLLPVPVDYQLRRISEILPQTWKTRKGDSIAALWQQAEGTYYRLNRIIADDVPPAQFKMILKLSLPANIEELMGYNNRSAAFIDVSFYDFSTNPNSTAFYNLSVWNENGAQVPMNYHPNSNGVSSQTNTLSFTFDAPVTLPKQATHVTVGFSIYAKNQQSLAIDYNQPRNTFSLNHVIMHDLEAGQQFYYPLSGNRTLSVGLPHKSLAVRPKKFRHNTVFLQYTVINLNKYPPVSPFYINSPYSAKITFVGSLNQYTVWQPLNKLSDNTYYWQNNNKARMIFEIYENVPPFREIGDLRAIQIRISGPRNSVWADPPWPAIDHTYYDDYKNASGFIGYYDRISVFQDPETKHPNPMFSIGDIWTSVTRCLDLDDKGICQSSDTKGVSNVYVADDYKVVQLLADDETVWLLSPTESDF